ncbi:hypothetical protein [Streptomyces lavendofoliae]|nr:hypothetical protein [Streptomyces lavendofoliae]
MLTTHHGGPFPPAARMSDYLRQLDDLDAEETEAACRRKTADRAADLTAIPLGARPVPIRLSILDTQRTVEKALLALADQVAADTHRAPLPVRPSSFAASTPRHWRQQHRVSRNAPTAALWLQARLLETPALSEIRVQQITFVAAGAAHRIDRALNLARLQTPLNRPCPQCAAPDGLFIEGGDGTEPAVWCAHCSWRRTAPA